MIEWFGRINVFKMKLNMYLSSTAEVNGREMPKAAIH